MAADSIVVDDDGSKATCAQPKIWQLGSYLIGAAGSCGADGFMRYSFRPPVLSAKDPDATVVGRFGAELVRQAKEAAADLSETELVLGCAGRLYRGDAASGYLWRVAEPYTAIGSGAAWAHGSLASSAGTPRNRLRTALSAAERHCAYVAAPFVFLQL